jgi:predicted MPP superfamily phosphohydrolase
MNQTTPEDKMKGISRRRFLLGGGFTLGGLVLGDAVYREPRAFQVEEVSLPLAKVPPGRELRIVHISDLHIRNFHGYYKDVANAIASLSPEVILLTGDYLERNRSIRNVQRFLKMLKAPQGIFAVQGNWEYWARVEGENLRRHFAGVGVTLLLNRRHDLTLQGVPVSILGLDYPSATDNLLLLQRRADPSRLNLLLSHVPAFAHESLNDRVDLILCGHTHGGQVRLPFVPPFYLPRFSGRFVGGLYQVGVSGTPLYVTRGVGTSLLPVRFLCRPEITIFRLHAAQ